MTDVLGRLRRQALARAAFVVDEEGTILASDSDAGTPLERLGHTAVDSIGGVEGLARQINTPDFGVLFHDVTGEDIYVSDRVKVAPWASCSTNTRPHWLRCDSA